MPLNDAVSLLENHGLRVKVEGHGTVKSQNIKGGSKLIKGTQITIELR
jgi:cell division protein FtsI (penicillin-binding protein 3)